VRIDLAMPFLFLVVIADGDDLPIAAHELGFDMKRAFLDRQVVLAIEGLADQGADAAAVIRNGRAAIDSLETGSDVPGGLCALAVLS
jgi:hypothetical protein